MGRSLKKDLSSDEHLMKKVEINKRRKEKKVIKTWSRRSTIFKFHRIHYRSLLDGRKHVPVYIQKRDLHGGHKLGEFAPTRTSQKGPRQTTRRHVENKERHKWQKYFKLSNGSLQCVFPRKSRLVLDNIRGKA